MYRQRWQIEGFFKWLKCLLGCRHWLAESRRGVTIQLYLALIASVLLQLATGRRPNQRMLELIRLHQLGWASLEELLAGVAREHQRAARVSLKNPDPGPGPRRVSRGLWAALCSETGRPSRATPVASPPPVRRVDARSSQLPCRTLLATNSLAYLSNSML